MCSVSQKYGLGHGGELDRHYAVISEPQGRTVFEQMEEEGAIQAGSRKTARVEARLEDEVWEATLLYGRAGGMDPAEGDRSQLPPPGSSQRKRKSLGNGLSA